MMWVVHDQANNQLHITFRKDRLIAQEEWFADNAKIFLALDGEPVSITVFNYYTNPVWPLTEVLVEKYDLSYALDDLKTIKKGFFNPAGRLSGMRVWREPISED